MAIELPINFPRNRQRRFRGEWGRVAGVGLCSGRGYESPHWGTLCSSGLVASSTTTEPSKLGD